ncbi:MAG: glycine--tRNA ligase subunit beta [Gammaproteobacteria bacterium]|nr:glycine--tRNA ligase subunit beta [Gammaproteobacteria bacterium]
MLKKKLLKISGDSLLIELLTEELPPKSLPRLSEAFANGVFDGLKEKHFLNESSAHESFATPRRLAVRVGAVLAKQLDRTIERKGPSLQSGLNADGQPTPALLGFARSCNADVAKLERRKDDKGEYFVYQLKQKGEPLAQHLPTIVEAALKKLPVAKLMRWGVSEVQFVRPVHGVILLHGTKVVAGTVLGLKSGNKTLGHRFLSKGVVVIKRATDYEKTLRTQGKLLAPFAERRQAIVGELNKAVTKFGKGASWQQGKALELVDEVTSIVESPHVYVGEFDPSFLDVPRECLIVSMQQHQKYFPVADAHGKLHARFLFAANMQPKDPRHIIHGNERVLRARLSDAKFFYDQDRKQPLEDRTPRLSHVVYHNKLGTQLERVHRLIGLAHWIAEMLQIDIAAAERAAYLCKADLLTDMVGEFPELQGIMGRYYACHDGEPAEIADAIEQHYLPRAAAGDLPQGPIAVAVALADKLDTLAGIFGIGLIPTGEKDPFGLRRAAVGVLRILIEKSLPLDLSELIDHARQQFKSGVLSANVSRDLQNFFFDRLRSYLREKGYTADEIEAVLVLNPARLDQVLPRLEAIRKFRALPEGQALAAANKRIHNILRQAGGGDPEKIAAAIDGALFQEPAEKELARQLGEAAMRVQPLAAKGDYAAALKELSQLRGAVDAFFEHVMVMVDDENLRTARLQLLAAIRAEFRRIADVSQLQG